MNQKTLKKPSPDFPLTPHRSGYWVKKVQGKTKYIGDRWSSPEDALREWNRIKDQLLTGETVLPDPHALQVRDAMNFFLIDREQRLESGEIVRRSYEDYVRECKQVVRVLGAQTAVSDLRPHDFARLKASYNSSSPNTLSGCITRVRVAFKYLYDTGLIDKPMRFGPSFKRPSAKTIRVYRASKPKKLFRAADLRLLVTSASPQLRAMILLGVNCGFGNNDCGSITIDKIDLLNSRHSYARPKTGIERSAWLWPETVAALMPIIGSRKAGHIFTTRCGKPWAKSSTANPISAEFRKLAKNAGVDQTFYALRHTFETIAGGSRDQVAVDYVMGHVPSGMSATYREEIAEDRIRAVCEFVREWYLK